MVTGSAVLIRRVGNSSPGSIWGRGIYPGIKGEGGFAGCATTMEIPKRSNINVVNPTNAKVLAGIETPLAFVGRISMCDISTTSSIIGGHKNPPYYYFEVATGSLYRKKGR